MSIFGQDRERGTIQDLLAAANRGEPIGNYNLFEAYDADPSGAKEKDVSMADLAQFLNYNYDQQLEERDANFSERFALGANNFSDMIGVSDATEWVGRKGGEFFGNEERGAEIGRDIGGDLPWQTLAGLGFAAATAGSGGTLPLALGLGALATGGIGQGIKTKGETGSGMQGLISGGITSAAPILGRFGGNTAAKYGGKYLERGLRPVIRATQASGLSKDASNALVNRASRSLSEGLLRKGGEEMGYLSADVIETVASGHPEYLFSPEFWAIQTVANVPLHAAALPHNIKQAMKGYDNFKAGVEYATFGEERGLAGETFQADIMEISRENKAGYVLKAMQNLEESQLENDATYSALTQFRANKNKDWEQVETTFRDWADARGTKGLDTDHKTTDTLGVLKSVFGGLKETDDYFDYLKKAREQFVNEQWSRDTKVKNPASVALDFIDDQIMNLSLAKVNLEFDPIYSEGLKLAHVLSGDNAMGREYTGLFVNARLALSNEETLAMTMDYLAQVGKKGRPNLTNPEKLKSYVSKFVGKQIDPVKVAEVFGAENAEALMKLRGSAVPHIKKKGIEIATKDELIKRQDIRTVSLLEADSEMAQDFRKNLEAVFIEHADNLPRVLEAFIETKKAGESYEQFDKRLSELSLTAETKKSMFDRMEFYETLPKLDQVVGRKLVNVFAGLDDSGLRNVSDVVRADLAWIAQSMQEMRRLVRTVSDVYNDANFNKILSKLQEDLDNFLLRVTSQEHVDSVTGWLGVFRDKSMSASASLKESGHTVTHELRHALHHLSKRLHRGVKILKPGERKGDTWDNVIKNSLSLQRMLESGENLKWLEHHVFIGSLSGKETFNKLAKKLSHAKFNFRDLLKERLAKNKKKPGSVKRLTDDEIAGLIKKSFNETDEKYYDGKSSDIDNLLATELVTQYSDFMTYGLSEVERLKLSDAETRTFLEQLQTLLAEEIEKLPGDQAKIAKVSALLAKEYNNSSGYLLARGIKAGSENMFGDFKILLDKMSYFTGLDTIWNKYFPNESNYNTASKAGVNSIVRAEEAKDILLQTAEAEGGLPITRDKFPTAEELRAKVDPRYDTFFPKKLTFWDHLNPNQIAHKFAHLVPQAVGIVSNLQKMQSLGNNRFYDLIQDFTVTLKDGRLVPYWVAKGKSKRWQNKYIAKLQAEDLGFHTVNVILESPKLNKAYSSLLLLNQELGNDKKFADKHFVEHGFLQMSHPKMQKALEGLHNEDAANVHRLYVKTIQAYQKGIQSFVTNTGMLSRKKALLISENFRKKIMRSEQNSGREAVDYYRLTPEDIDEIYRGSDFYLQTREGTLSDRARAYLADLEAKGHVLPKGLDGLLANFLDAQQKLVQGYKSKYIDGRKFYASEQRYGRYARRFTTGLGSKSLIAANSKAELIEMSKRLFEKDPKTQFGQIFTRKPSDESVTINSDLIGDMAAAEQAAFEGLLNRLTKEGYDQEIIGMLNDNFFPFKGAEEAYDNKSVVGFFKTRDLDPGRELLQGFDQMVNHFNSMANLMTKHEADINNKLLLAADEFEQHPDLKEYWAEYNANMLKNESYEFTNAKNAVSLFYIGGVVGTAIADSTQPFVTMLPDLLSRGAGGRQSMGYIKTAYSWLTSGKAEKKGTGTAKDKAIRVGFNKFLSDMPELAGLGSYSDLYSNNEIRQAEAYRIKSDRKMMKVKDMLDSTWSGVTKAGRMFTAISSGLNAKVAMLSYLQYGYDQGIRGDALYNYAVDGMNTSMASAGKYSYPTFISKFGKMRSVAGLMMTLQNFSVLAVNQFVNNIQGSLNRIPGLSKAEVKARRKAFAAQLGVTLVAAGVTGMPFVMPMVRILEQAIGEDIEGEIRKEMAKLFDEQDMNGDVITSMLMDGFAATASNTNINSRMSLAPFLMLDDYQGFNFGGLVGPAGSLPESIFEGAAMAAQGKSWSKNPALPIALRNVLSAIDGKYISRSGVQYGDDMTPVDRALQVAGIRDKEVVNQMKAKRSLEIRRDKDSREINQGLKEANELITKGRFQEARELIDEIRKEYGLNDTQIKGRLRALLEKGEHQLDLTRKRGTLQPEEQAGVLRGFGVRPERRDYAKEFRDQLRREAQVGLFTNRSNVGSGLRSRRDNQITRNLMQELLLE